MVFTLRLLHLHVCALAVLTLALCPQLAWAQDQPTLSGTWSATAMSEKWSTAEWGDACGPKPSGGGGAPANGVVGHHVFSW